LTFLIALIAVALPSAPFWKGQQAYAQTLGLVGRIVLGGLVSYLVSQHFDVWAFLFWRKRTKGRWLWVRNNLSTLTSQLINTILFVLIVFTGVIPNAALIPTICGHFLVKALLAIADTPFIYLGVWWVRRSEPAT